MIDPHGQFVKVWDSVVFGALFFTAIVTPFEVAYLEPSLDALFLVNRLIDALFVTVRGARARRRRARPQRGSPDTGLPQDMVCQFFMGYTDALGVWCTDRREIAARYLRGWFSIDLLSIMPFDVIGVLTGACLRACEW